MHIDRQPPADACRCAAAGGGECVRVAGWWVLGFLVVGTITTGSFSFLSARCKAHHRRRKGRPSSGAGWSCLRTHPEQPRGVAPRGGAVEEEVQQRNLVPHHLHSSSSKTKAARSRRRSSDARMTGTSSSL